MDGAPVSFAKPVAARWLPLVHFLHSADFGAQPRRSAVFPGARQHSAVPMESAELADPTRGDNHGRIPSLLAEKNNFRTWGNGREGRRGARGGGRGFCGAPAEASVGQVLACCFWRSLSPLGAGPPAGKFLGRDGAHSVLSDFRHFCTLRFWVFFRAQNSRPVHGCLPHRGQRAQRSPSVPQTAAQHLGAASSSTVQNL